MPGFQGPILVGGSSASFLGPNSGTLGQEGAVPGPHDQSWQQGDARAQILLMAHGAGKGRCQVPRPDPGTQGSVKPVDQPSPTPLAYRARRLSTSALTRCWFLVFPCAVISSSVVPICEPECISIFLNLCAWLWLLPPPHIFLMCL